MENHPDTVHPGPAAAPPGDLAIWFFILAELLAFGVFFGAYAFGRAHNVALFNEMQQHLDRQAGAVNTVLLITGSWCVARAVEAVERSRSATGARWLAAGIACGGGFLVVKGFEYAAKFGAGINLSTNTFYMFYLSLTFFHFMHVILGMVIYGVFEGEGAGTLASSRPFWSGDAHVIPMITGATILCFSFTGFDGISNLSEETKDAERVIPRAIFLTALIGGMIFIFATYFLQLYFPDISRFKDPDASQPEIMLYVAGKAFQVGALIFSTITVLASGMAAHAGVARLMYVMGRDGVFPKSFFGYVHPTWRTPAMNIILVGAIALLAINFDLVMATALINFGALVAFTFVNLSVISQFWIREKRNKTLKDHFQYLFLPMCGALTVGALWVNLEESSMVLGLIWAAIGLIYLACVTKSFRNPVPQYEDVA